MGRGNIDKLVGDVEDFMKRKGRTRYKKHGIKIKYSGDASALKSQDTLLISYKRLFRKENILYLRENGKESENYLTPTIIGDIERIIYKK